MKAVDQIKNEREQLAAQIEALKAENLRLLEAQRRVFSLRVSEKGAVSVYGLGRFPVTLYKEQWDTLLSHTNDIKTFMVENASKLKLRESK